MMAFTSTVFVARVIVQVWRRRTFEAQDALLYIAFAAYLAFTILYVVITPIFFKLEALAKGELAPWPSMPQDLKLASEVMWCSGMLYWTCLWFVKFSLLALYKKLLAGMPDVYRWTWWGTLVFCILVRNAVRIDMAEKRLTSSDVGNMHHHWSRSGMRRHQEILR